MRRTRWAAQALRAAGAVATGRGRGLLGWGIKEALRWRQAAVAASRAVQALGSRDQRAARVSAMAGSESLSSRMSLPVQPPRSAARSLLARAQRRTVVREIGASTPAHRVLHLLTHCCSDWPVNSPSGLIGNLEWRTSRMRWGEGGAEETPSARRRLRERRSFESTALRTRETQSAVGSRG